MSEEAPYEAGSPYIAEVEVSQRRGVSPIWLLPIIALFVGAWLVYKTLAEAGADIEIIFKTVNGVYVGKTKVIYQGVNIGRVTDIHLNDDMQSVRVSVQIKPEAEALLTASTQFWLVKPKVSLSGISGLETLVTGAYIAIRPGVGDASRTFVARLQEPSLDPMTPGLHLRLRTQALGSIGVGSKLYFKQLPVGEVQSYALAGDHSGILIEAFIAQPYQHLVEKNTRFWHASGLSVKGDLSGISIKTESLSALVGGGIAFFTPTSKAPHTAAENGDTFDLLKDFAQAKPKPQGLHLTLKSQDKGSIDRGTAIFYKNIAVGSIQNYRLSKDHTAVEFDAHIQPEYRHLVRRNTRFWQASGVTLKGKLTEFSVQAGSLSSILNGGIAFLTPDQSQPNVADNAAFPLYLDYDAASERGAWLQKPGLPLTLRAKALGAISVGSAVYYKRVKVGEVRAWRLSQNDRHVMIDIVIQHSYQHLVKSNARFWQASGVTVSGSLTGIKVRAESLAAVLEGGLAFFSPNTAQKKSAKAGQVFQLYADYEAATLNGRLLPGEHKAGLSVQLIADNLGSIEVHSPVFYQKMPIGEVTHFNLHADNRRVVLHVRIQPRYAHLIRKKSRFWNASGISASANLSGINIRAESIKSIFNGGIGVYAPAQRGEKSHSGDHFTLYADQTSARQAGLPITILFQQNQNLHVGAAIRYQGINVGKITDIRLSRQAGVEVQAVLFDEAKHFAVAGTQFWVVRPKIGLAKTENLSALISGNHLAIAPGEGQRHTQFKGLKQAPIERARTGLNIVLKASQLGAIKVHDPVYYRQIEVGQVLGFSLAPSADYVLIQVNIEPAYERLVRTHSQFWNMSGIDADFSMWEGLNLKTSTLEAILEGGIGFATPNNAHMGPPAQTGDEYLIHQEFDEQWLQWAPKISLKGG